MSKDIVETFSGSQALQDNGKLADIIQENMGDEGIKPSDLGRVKIPAGGGSAFEVPTLEGSEMNKSLKGIILHKQVVRAFWAEDLEEAGESAPDCMSRDGKIGEVQNEEYSNLGGLCKECPKNEWGSGDGDAKACTKKWQVYILLPGDMLPTIISLPPTSIKPMRQYLFFLSKKGYPKYSVVTEFGLKKAKSDSGIKYSVITASADETLDAKTKSQVKDYRDSFVESLQQIQGEDIAYDEKELNTQKAEGSD